MLSSVAGRFARNRLSSLVALTVLATSNAFAETNRRHHAYRRQVIYGARPAEIALQPFSLDGAPRLGSAIQVAYYAPRPAPRAQPVDPEDENESGPQLETNTAHPTVPGNRAVLRNGIAYAPANAPDSVKSAIWAANTIRTKPYVWGGGHGSFHDYGYDCSGAVSFTLHSAGALNQPLGSTDLLRYGEHGRGRWITIYARHGHTFAMIAGLRFDTTDFRYGGDVGPRWYNIGRDTWGFEARHQAGL
jgi:cell wall-associated NlpC family hydrolase